MIPDFDDLGNLPPGVHPATLEEIAARFGWQSEIRHAETESLGWLIPLALKAGVKRLIINGSFVTSAEEPNDVDCVLLIGDDYPQDSEADAELLVGLPFAEIKIVLDEAFDDYVRDVFGTDRHDNPKGMIEVLL
jgi:hypothetical protein